MAPTLNECEDKSLKQNNKRKHKLKHRHKHQITEECTSKTDNDEHIGDVRDLIQYKIAELEITKPLKESDNFDYEDIRHENRMKSMDGEKILESILQEELDQVCQLNLLKTAFLDYLSYIYHLESNLNLCNEKICELKKSNDLVSAELVKSNLLQEKLQRLCRGLQQQNKTIVADSKRIADQEHAKRQELSDKFHKTIEEVSAKLNQQGADCVVQLRENENLREKLSLLIQQYETREEQYNHQLKAQDLKTQLAEAKLNHQLEVTAQVKAQSELLAAQLADTARKEAELQAQLQLYGGKFEVFQETLNKSNNVFESLKAESTRMSKAMKNLEKENANLKVKCQKYDLGAIAAISEKKKSEQQLERKLEKYENQLKHMQGLCRVLQKERDEYRDKVLQNSKTTTNSHENEHVMKDELTEQD